MKRYERFEPFTMDHTRFGVELLFGNQNADKKDQTDMPGDEAGISHRQDLDDRMIQKFVKEDTWDDIIRVAIDQHSLYEL